MKKKAFILFLPSFLLGALSACSDMQAQELTPSQIKNNLSSSVVKVCCYDLQKKAVLSQGTGFFIDNSGTFITNFHVVEKSYHVQIQTSTGMKKWVDKVNFYNSSTSDFAICSVQSLSSKAVTFSDDVATDDVVYSLGYPNGSYSIVEETGKVVSPSVSAESKTYIENTAKIDHGSSGGILANKYGKVVGITTGQLENNNYIAVPYKAFSSSLTKKTINKEPLETFHNVQKKAIGSYNLDTYFNYKIETSVDNGKYLSCYFYVQLKTAYWTNSYLSGITSLYLSYKITIDYKYKTTYSSTISTWTAQDFASFNIYNSSLTDIHKDYINLDYTGSGTITSRSNLKVTSFGGTGTLCLVY